MSPTTINPNQSAARPEAGPQTPAPVKSPAQGKTPVEANSPKRTALRPRPPVLRFTPTAWAKLLFLRDYGETEVGGFGIAAGSSGDELLAIERIELVRQECSWAHVAFDDESVADLFDRQVDAGRTPEQFGRIWIHTHPGDCPRPSGVDEATFTRVFGRSTWAVMFILARGGQTYARLRFNTGPGGECELPVEIDYRRPFDGCDLGRWEQEYLTNVRLDGTADRRKTAQQSALQTDERLELFEREAGDSWFDAWQEYAGEPDLMKGDY